MLTGVPLMVKCKGCYTPFPVPDQMDERTFAEAQMPTESRQCPHCGIRRPYDKGDYFFGSPESELPPPWQ
jgi:RNase P subunit RPR2